MIVIDSENVKTIDIKGDRFTDWIIHYCDVGAVLCVGTLLVSECKTLQEAIQDMINIELEEVDEDERI